LFQQKRILMLYLVFAGFFLFLLGRLFYIQFIQGEKYAQQAVAQRQQTVNHVQFPRGQILDRKLRPFTNVEEKPTVVVFPRMMQKRSEIASFLSSQLNLPLETVMDQLKLDPVILKTNLSEKEISLIKNADLPGVYVLPIIPRYQNNWPAVHIIGSIGRISETEYQATKRAGKEYRLEDIIGKNGLEKQYEEVLKSTSSEKIAAMVDLHGQHIKETGFTIIHEHQDLPDNLTHVVTTLDFDYQKVTEAALEGYEGAAVVLDVWNGDILAMASSPKYDPYLLDLTNIKDVYINKALQKYPSAEIFEIFLKLATLEEGIEQHEEGEVGSDLSGEKILKYAEKFGLNNNEIIGYDLTPTSHFSLNDISLSPLLGAKLLAQVANGGFSITPRLVAAFHNDQGRIIKEFSSALGERIISAESTRMVKSHLYLAGEEDDVSANQNTGIETAGIRGSSESDGGMWFAGFAPVDIPKWAVVVFVQKSSFEGQEAAFIFQNIVSGLAQSKGMHK
jgi:penicillin-binding protein 2